MLVSLGGELVEPRIAVRGGVGKIEHAVLVTLLEHLVEDRTPPAFCSVTFLARAVLETFRLVGLNVVPTEAAAFENRVQRVDHDEPVGQRYTLGATALAKAADQLAFGQAGQALADQPIHQAKAWNDLHGTNYAAQS